MNCLTTLRWRNHLPDKPSDLEQEYFVKHWHRIPALDAVRRAKDCTASKIVEDHTDDYTFVVWLHVDNSTGNLSFIRVLFLYTNHTKFQSLEDLPTKYYEYKSQNNTSQYRGHRQYWRAGYTTSKKTTDKNHTVL